MTDDFDDLDLNDILGDSNAGAYQKAELRQGPPLAYVSEKIRYSLEQLHHLIMVLGKDLTGSPAMDEITFSIKTAFQYELVAFLALHNLLSLANDRSLLQRLCNMTYDAFQEWLDGIQDEGSVTG
jgi:hypothetical protein